MENLVLNSNIDNRYHIGRVLIMDSCPIVLDGINRFFCLPRFKVEHRLTATMAADIPAMLVKNKVDLVIMELKSFNESALDGLRIINQLVTLWPSIPVIVCTALTDARLLWQVAAVGVNGIYLKEEPLSALIRCVVQVVMQKKCSYSTGALRIIRSREEPFSDPQKKEKMLTSREIVVMNTLFTGHSVTATAHLLKRDIRTISAQKRNSMAKLSFNSDCDFYKWGAKLACNS